MARKKGEGSFSRGKDAEGFYSWTLSLGINPATGKEKNKVIKRRSQKELKEEVRKYLRAREDGVPSTQGNSLTAAAWAERWLETVRLTRERKTHKSYADTWRLWMAPRMGRKLLENLGTSDVQAAVNDAVKAGHNPTARYVLVVTKTMLGAARRHSPPYIRHDPCDGVVVPPPNPPRRRVLSHEEVDELFEEMYRAEPYKTREGERAVYPYRHLVRFMLETGLREAEALGLQEFQVDLKADPPRVVVAGQIDVDEEGNPIVKPYTKGKNDRTVYLSPAAVEAVREQRKIVAGYRAAAKEAYCEMALVFPSEAGTPVGYRNFLRSIEDLRDAVNAKRAAQGEPPRAHWTPHDLRRTFGTRIAQTGKGLKVTQKLMGHKNEATTAKIYVIAEDEDMIAAVKGMRNRRAEG